MDNALKIAVQKSGRLNEDSLNLFRECGIKFNSSGGKLKTTSSNFPVEFLFLRDDDIPGYVEQGVADIGIIGEDIHAETNKNVHVVKRLGFSKCRLCIAISRENDFDGINSLEGKNIATSYPRILGKYLQEKGVTSNIYEISGSVEIAPSIGLAHAICDIVSSGDTLLSNGLKEVAEVFESQAIMIGYQSIDTEKDEILQNILFRIDAVQRAKDNKYVFLNTRNENIEKIAKLLPGMKSPSVIPLAFEGWSAMSSVIKEDAFWENIEKLCEAGAEGILVMPIGKMVI
jgi:ATP phosphoribosyltransferase